MLKLYKRTKQTQKSTLQFGLRKNYTRVLHSLSQESQFKESWKDKPKCKTWPQQQRANKFCGKKGNMIQDMFDPLQILWFTCFSRLLCSDLLMAVIHVLFINACILIVEELKNCRERERGRGRQREGTKALVLVPLFIQMQRFCFSTVITRKENMLLAFVGDV